MWAIEIIGRSVTRTVEGLLGSPAEVWPWGWMALSSLFYPLVVGVALLVLAWVVLPGVWRWMGMMFSPVAVLGLFMLSGAQVVDGARMAWSASAGVRVASLNVLVVGTHDEEKLAFLRNVSADVVGLIEMYPALLDRLGEVSDVYPHGEVRGLVANHMYGDPQVMVLLSKHPLTLVKNWGEELALYKVDAPTPFYVLQIHPFAPSTPERLRGRDAAFAALAQEELPRPLVVMGDFNTTPWDRAVRDFAAKQALQVVGSYGPTFPRVAPLTPIDLVLVSGEVQDARVQRVRVAGTDHLGVVAEMTVRGQQGERDDGLGGYRLQ